MVENSIPEFRKDGVGDGGNRPARPIELEYKAYRHAIAMSEYHWRRWQAWIYTIVCLKWKIWEHRDCQEVTK